MICSNKGEINLWQKILIDIPKKKRGRLISLSDRIRVVELNEAKDNGPG
jgi:hypothetical protein